MLGPNTNQQSLQIPGGVFGTQQPNTIRWGPNWKPVHEQAFWIGPNQQQFNQCKLRRSICVIGVELNHKVKYPPLQFELDFMAQLMKHPTENIIYNYRFGGNQWNCHCDSITDKQVLCNISTNLFSLSTKSTIAFRALLLQDFVRKYRKFFLEPDSLTCKNGEV